MKRLRVTVKINRAGQPLWDSLEAIIEDVPKSRRVKRLPRSTRPGRFFHGTKTPDLSANLTHRSIR